MANANLAISSKTTKEEQLMEDKVEHTAKIANEHIFLEHLVKNMRTWKWFQKIPINQIDLIDPLLTVAVGFTNFLFRPAVKKEVTKIYPDQPCWHDIMYNTDLQFNALN